MKILLVDDDPDFLECCALMLRLREPHEVVTAASVDQALERLEEGGFHALITDYTLADDLTGGDLLATVAARFPTIRRMLFSASSLPAKVEAHVVLNKIAGIEKFLDAVVTLERASD